MRTRDIAKTAKQASIYLAGTSKETKDKALHAIANGLDKNRQEIISANKQDLEDSEKNNLAQPLLKRLKFDDKKLDGVIEGIKSLMDIPDPVGETLSATALDNGLELYKVSCPIGLIGVIFESRPDALVQISTLCLKSGNSVLLKGGSEAKNTNRILTEIIQQSSRESGIAEGWVQLLESRAEVNEMLGLDAFIDLIIPRGSNEFVRYIMDHSNIPVLGHADGICHLYIDAAADPDMAVNLAVDSKVQYVAVCNALETLLVNEMIAPKVMTRLKEQLEEHHVEIRGCEKTRTFVDVKAATENDWKTEYLDYILSIKIVEDMDEAIAHINTYGSHHTDVIVTSDKNEAAQFMNLVDSGNVFWNCSTRFSDGYRYGLGAEVGISTNKIHARGPVGLEGLLIYKWKLIGNGQAVQGYADGHKKFQHQAINTRFYL
jgi:glutamate-5-semialdehyde dehydrogenase